MLNKPIAAPTGVKRKTNEATIPYTPLVIPLMMWLISYHHQLARATKPPIPPLNKLIP
jgi:hypothetical protein